MTIASFLTKVFDKMTEAARTAGALIATTIFNEFPFPPFSCRAPSHCLSLSRVRANTHTISKYTNEERVSLRRPQSPFSLSLSLLWQWLINIQQPRGQDKLIKTQISVVTLDFYLHRKHFSETALPEKSIHDAPQPYILYIYIIPREEAAIRF